MALPSVGMIRDSDSVLARHRQRFPHSVGTSLLELMIKLMGGQAPDLQSLEAVLPQGWKNLINQTAGGVTVRRAEWDPVMFRHLAGVELSQGRPVGLLLKETGPEPSLASEQAWAVIRLNEIRPYVFLDLVGKNPELGGGEGQFSVKRVLRLDEIVDSQVTAVFYCEPIVYKVKRE
jgi:hypothetical protein